MSGPGYVRGGPRHGEQHQQGFVDGSVAMSAKTTMLLGGKNGESGGSVW